MQNANIFLTGASSGLGKDMALGLADSGHRVFAGMRDPAGRNRAAASELSAHPAAQAITPVELDVCSDESVAAAVTTVLDEAGQIDVCINCAAVMWLGVTEAYTIQQFEEIIQTNLFGPFRLMKAVLPGMRARRDGLVITITSLAGRGAVPGFGIYGASKSALETLAETIRYEVAGLGVDSVILEPGPFPSTNLNSSQQDPAEADVIASYGEYGRFRERAQSGARAVGSEVAALMEPRLVTDLVCNLVAMPKGSRPVRQYVGVDFGLDALNDATVRFQEGFLRALGMEHVLKVKG